MSATLGSTDAGLASQAQSSVGSPDASPPVTGRWAAWPVVGVRSAGFPVHLALGLADPSLAAETDALLTAESREEEAWSQAHQALEHALDALRAEGRWEDRATRQSLLKGLHAARARKLSDALEVVLPAAGLDRLRAAVTERQACVQSWEGVWLETTEQQSRGLRRLARLEDLQEAVLWQNRAAYENAFLPLAEPTDAAEDASASHAALRKAELTVASYVQRYCLKNDTIGFFGPMGWARCTSAGDRLTFTPGRRRIAARVVRLEAWPFQALAQKLSRDPAIRRWLKPQMRPFARLEAGRLHLPGQTPLELSPAWAALLALCRGEQTADALARELAASYGEAAPKDAVLAWLAQLEQVGVIAWELAVPVHPEAQRFLREQLEAVEDADLRQRSLQPLEALEQHLSALEQAASVKVLASALGDLDQAFEAFAGVPAMRNPGKTYGGRTLAYLDCRRDLEMTIGPTLQAEIFAPLDLLLHASRWFSWELANSLRKRLEAAFERLPDAAARHPVEATAFWPLATSIVLDPRDELVGPLRHELQERWQSLLAGATGHSSATQFRSVALRSAVAQAFAAPAAGWELAGISSPDVLIAAASLEAIRKDDFLLVLGELHSYLNTLNYWAFTATHEQPAEIAGLVERGRASALVFVPPRSFAGRNPRTETAFHPVRSPFLPSADEPCPHLGARAIPLAELVVERSSHGLRLRARNGSLDLDLIEALGDALSARYSQEVRFWPDAPHQPRLTFDRLVVRRESWRFPLEQLGFAGERSREHRFLGCQRWARAQRLPRWLFVKAPGEAKPFWLDLASAVFVELFCRSLRTSLTGVGAGEVVLSEMLPEPSQSWLPDAEGRSYVSELRFVLTEDLPPAAGPSLVAAASLGSGSPFPFPARAQTSAGPTNR